MPLSRLELRHGCARTQSADSCQRESSTTSDAAKFGEAFCSVPNMGTVSICLIQMSTSDRQDHFAGRSARIESLRSRLDAAEAANTGLRREIVPLRQALQHAWQARRTKRATCAPLSQWGISSRTAGRYFVTFSSPVSLYYPVWPQRRGVTDVASGPAVFPVMEREYADGSQT